jgi:hypothetical protein
MGFPHKLMKRPVSEPDMAVLPLKKYDCARIAGFLPTSLDPRTLKSPPRAVPDMVQVHLFAFLGDAVDHTINMRLVAIEEMRSLAFSGVSGQRFG